MVSLGGDGGVGRAHPTAAAAVAYLQSPQAIRDRCRALFTLAEADRLQHWRYHPEALPAVADYVLAVMRQQYPDGDVPFHSRWRHFEVEGRSRLERLDPALSALEPLEQARIKVDLAIISVLLDAGAGSQWRYVEPETDLEFARSEGLAIASFHTFAGGLSPVSPINPGRRMRSASLSSPQNSSVMTSKSTATILCSASKAESPCCKNWATPCTNSQPSSVPTCPAQGTWSITGSPKPQTTFCRPLSFCKPFSRVSAPSGRGEWSWAG